MTRRLAAALAIVVASVANAEILGKKPDYLPEAARSFPNDQAVVPRIWAPGLDEGYAPQGLARVGPYFLVSAYQDLDSSRPSCRVFRLEADTGAPAGFFDMPEPCRHAGGITSIGGGIVVVGDTRQIWRVDLEQALKSGRAEGATRGMVKMARGMGSAFVFFDGKDLWTGVNTTVKDAADAKIYRLDVGVFERLDGKTLTPALALEALAIPPLAQGAAFDADGNIWISASTSQLGFLYRIDRKTGAILSRYDTINGIEGIDFDSSGHLWSISEAGARKYMHWPRHFPLIFEIDVAKLKQR